jgi:hypothetical protein
MSHRTALVLSVVLTLILASVVLIGRDRFFVAEANPGTTAVPGPAIAGESTSAESKALSSDVTRVIEIPLPTVAEQDEHLSRVSDAERGGRESDDTHSRRSDEEDDSGEDDD